MYKHVKFAAAVVMSVAGAASAEQSLITFSFSDLSASYNNNTRVFNADAIALPNGINTGGDVSRVDTAPTQTANFTTGFRAALTSNVQVSMNIDSTLVSIGVNPSYEAHGNFTLTDEDGDVITGSIGDGTITNGRWSNLGGGFNSFQGLITIASIVAGGGRGNTRPDRPPPGG